MSNIEKMSRKRYVQWSDIDLFAEHLISQVKDKGYAGIYGIPRGGIILAVIISYRLGIPLLSAPCKNCLVIDEISATGKALNNYTGRYDIAVMHYFTDSSVKPTYYGEIITDEWMIYPWE